MLTSRERVQAALEHQEPDRVPVDMGSMHTCIETYAYEPLKRVLGFAPERPVRTFVRDHVEPDPELLERFGIDTLYVRIGAPDAWRLVIEQDNSFVDEWGAVWRKPEGSLYFDPVDFPMASASLGDVERWPWPDPKDPGRTRGLREKAKRLREGTDKAICLDTIGLGIFETAWMLRGIQNVLCDLMADQELAEAMFTKIADVKVGMYEQVLDEVGDLVDVVFASDDLGTQRGPMMSPSVFRKMLKPHEARLFGAIKARTKAKLFCHSCGGIRPFIPDLIEIGLDILNPAQPFAHEMASTDLKREFGQNLSFWGAVDEQSVLPRGTPEQVREEVRTRIRELGKGGGYVLGPSHNVQGDVPPENIVAMYDAAREYGAYPIRSDR